jgi:hypothetical protein
MAGAEVPANLRAHTGGNPGPTARCHHTAQPGVIGGGVGGHKAVVGRQAGAERCSGVSALGSAWSLPRCPGCPTSMAALQAGASAAPAARQLPGCRCRCRRPAPWTPHPRRRSRRRRWATRLRASRGVRTRSAGYYQPLHIGWALHSNALPAGAKGGWHLAGLLQAKATRCWAALAGPGGP